MKLTTRFVDLPLDRQMHELAETLHEHEEDSRFPFPNRKAYEVFQNRCALVAGATNRTVDDVVAAVRTLAVAIPEERRRAEREEADRLAHDRVEPDAVYDCFQALSIYVEAFHAGARYANERRARR